MLQEVEPSPHSQWERGVSMGISLLQTASSPDTAAPPSGMFCPLGCSLHTSATAIGADATGTNATGTFTFGANATGANATLLVVVQ